MRSNSTLSPAHNEFSYNEHPTRTNRFLYTIIIDSNAKKFGFFCIFLLVASGTQCTVHCLFLRLFVMILGQIYTCWPCVPGLRGAIAFALSLHLEFENEKRHVIVTTTLIIVLFTVLILGGSTMPLLKV